MKASKKIKSTLRQTLDLDSLNFLDEPEIIDLTVSEKETKKKKNNKWKNKKNKEKNLPATLAYKDALPLCKTVEEVEGW